MSKKFADGSVTIDMLRAFASLAETLNLTETANRLAATRQTIRRHINELEMIKGDLLFKVEKQSYVLTPMGEASVSYAKFILQHVKLWNQHVNYGGSHYLSICQFTDARGLVHHSLQHPISEVSRTGGELMKRALTAWAEGATLIESSAMKNIRPNLVIYRMSPEGWICVEVGKKSAYAEWFGWTWSRSAIGRLSHQDNVGGEFNEFIAEAYARIYGEGGVRLDHILAHLPREGSDLPIQVTFQRLLMGCTFPDGTPALAVLVIITDK